MRISHLLPLTLLIACGDKEPEEDTSALTFLDKDNDGFSQDDGDCNDEDALIHPDALELCDKLDNNCNGYTDEDGAFDAVLWFLDGDNDGYGIADTTVESCTQPQGYATNQVDCDDTNPNAYPKAEEVCDKADNDCDGTIDEGTATDAGTWYADADGDGYGSYWDVVVDCNQPSGYVDNGEDCNDRRSDVNPGMVELCDDDGTDEDCDDLFNDDDDLVEGRPVWYIDADGDGWGLETTTYELCTQPTGYVEQYGDCDDSERYVNPDQAEQCGNNVDDNCNEVIDEETAPFPLLWYVDADGDGYGDPDEPGLTQCSEPVGFASNNEDCNDSNNSIYPGAVEIWYDGEDYDCAGDSDYDADGDGYDADGHAGTDCDDFDESANPGLPEVCGDNVDNNCDDDTDPCEEDAALYGTADDDLLGSSVGFAGDWDGDGYSDLLVGAPKHDGTGNAMGGVYVVSGPVTGSSDVSTVSSVYFYGANDQDYVGSAVAGLGDIDDDGYSDILMGAYGFDGAKGGATESGAFYLHYGPEFGSKALATSYDILWWGEASYDWAGFSVSNAGDYNDDGEVDFIVSAYRNDSSNSDAGATYMLLGPVTATDQNLSYANIKFSGTAASEWSGYSVAGADEIGGGDIDGDGYDDIVIGAPQLYYLGDYVGGAYVVSGESSPSSAFNLAYAEGRLIGVSASSLTGYSVAIAGDVNRDGYADVLVGAPEEASNGNLSGTGYLVHGPISGDLVLDQADAIFAAENNDDYLGSAVSTAGDVDDDDRDDVLLGANKDDFNDSDAGAAYIMLAPLLGTVEVTEAGGKLAGANYADLTGSAVFGGSDINLDGYDDVFVGSPYNDDNTDDGGAAYLVLGGGF
jgi:hypothetical protein